MFELILNPQKKETTVHGNSCFPFALYRGPVSSFANGAVDWHWHEYFEFNIVTCGELQYQVETERFHLHEGQIIFINSRRMHRSLWCSSDEYSLTLVFHGKLFCDDPFSDWYQQVIDPFIHSSVNALKIDVSSEWGRLVQNQLENACVAEAERSVGYELWMKSCLCAAFSVILKQYAPKESSFTDHLNQGEKALRIRQLLYYIHQNYQHPITLADLAGSAGLSEGECSRFFKKQLKQSPFSYLNEYRIKKSCDSLIETDLSISEIAAQSGFNSFSYYSKRFYQIMLCSPAEYRKKIRNAKQEQQIAEKDG